MSNRVPTEIELQRFHPDLVVTIDSLDRGKGKTTLGIVIEWLLKAYGWEVLRNEQSIPHNTAEMHAREAAEFRAGDMRKLEPRKVLINIRNWRAK